MTPADMVAEFHHAFGCPVNTIPTADLPTALVELRIALIDEEATEVAEAARNGDVVAVAKELADLLYVTYGAAHTYGIDLDAVVAEVHRSNMSKLGADGRPILRADGKVLKSSLYREADVAAVLGVRAVTS